MFTFIILAKPLQRARAVVLKLGAHGAIWIQCLNVCLGSVLCQMKLCSLKCLHNFGKQCQLGHICIYLLPKRGTKIMKFENHWDRE